MAKIIIDAGHGGTDPGAVNGMRRESADVLGLGMAVAQILAARCHQVTLTRQSDVFRTLQQRANISNSVGPAAFVSIHRNASTNTGAGGVETFHRPGATAAEVTLARNIQNRMATVGGFANRGVSSGNFFVLNQTQAPAALVEAGFISNAGDNTRFDNNAVRLAYAIADGIEDSVGKVPGCQGGTGPTPPPTPPTPPTPAPPTGATLTGRVQTTSGNLNLRGGPGTQNPVVGSIPNGTTLNLLNEQNGFYQTTFSGVTGWASSAFVVPNPRAGVVATQSGNLNVRSGPSASAAVIASLPNGTTLTVRDIAGNFYAITAGNVSGYASRDFVRLT